MINKVKPTLLTKFTKKEINDLFSNAQPVFKDNGLEIRIAPKVLDYGRILIVTPRKAGNAPARNLIRRRLKSIFYEQKLYADKYDFIVLVKPGAVSLSFDTLKNILLDVVGNNKTNRSW